MADLDPITGLPFEENDDELSKAIREAVKTTSTNRRLSDPSFQEINPRESDYTQAQFEEFGTITSGSSQRDLEINRAERQSGVSQGFNALGRVAANVIPTVIGNVASILDVEDYANQDKEIGNAVTEAMDEWKQSVNKALPIHRRNAGKSLDLSDSGWWWENGSSLAESIGAFAITGAMTGGAFSWLTGLANLGKAGAAASTLLTATGLNQAEAITSASEVYQGTLKHARSDYDRVMRDPESKKDPALQQLLSGGREEYAKSIAADAAAHTINMNRMNIALNLTSASMFVRSPNISRNLIEAITKRNTLKNIAGEAIQEGLEEEINLISEKSGMAKGQGKEYSLMDAMEDATSAEGAEAAILGAVGGIGQTGATIAIGNLPGGAIAQKKKRFEHQRSVIEGIEKISKDANVKNLTNVFDTLEETKKLNERRNELLAKGEAITAEEVEELHNLAERQLEVQAHAAFSSGTTEALEEQFIKLSEMSEEEAIKKNLHDGKTKSTDPDYYKNRARKGLEKIRKSELIYNEVKGKYVNDTEVYLNRTKTNALQDIIAKRDEQISTLENEKSRLKEILLKDPEFSKLSEKEQDSEISKLSKVIDKKINLARVSRNSFSKELKDNLTEGIEITSKEYQETFIEKEIEKRKKAAEDAIRNAKTAEEAKTAKEEAIKNAKTEEEKTEIETAAEAATKAAEETAVTEAPIPDVTKPQDEFVAEVNESYDNEIRKLEDDKEGLKKAFSKYKLGLPIASINKATTLNEIIEAVTKNNNRKKNHEELIEKALKEFYSEPGVKNGGLTAKKTAVIPKESDTKNPVIISTDGKEQEVNEQNAAEGEGDESAAEFKAASPFNSQTTEMEVERNPETGKWETTIGEDGAMVKDTGANEQAGVDWEFINNGGLEAGDDIQYEIDLDTVNDSEDDYHSDLLAKGAEAFQEKVQILMVHYVDGNVNNKSPENRKVVGMLAATKEHHKNTKEGEALIALRKEIWKDLHSSILGGKGILTTGYATEVDHVMGGRLTITEEFTNPVTIAGENDLIFAVAVNAGGVVQLKTGKSVIGKLPDDYGDIPISFTPDNLTIGAVYMLVPNANGTYIPARIFTQKLSENEEVLNKVLGYLEKASKNPKDYDVTAWKDKEHKDIARKNIKKLNTNIKKLISVDIYVNKNGTINIKQKVKGKNKTVKTLNLVNEKGEFNTEGMIAFFGEKPIQIDSNLINTGAGDKAYNNRVSNAGIVTANLRPGQVMHSAKVVVKPTNSKGVSSISAAEAKGNTTVKENINIGIVDEMPAGAPAIGDTVIFRTGKNKGETGVVEGYKNGKVRVRKQNGTLSPFLPSSLKRETPVGANEVETLINTLRPDNEAGVTIQEMKDHADNVATNNPKIDIMDHMGKMIEALHNGETLAEAHRLSMPADSEAQFTTKEELAEAETKELENRLEEVAELISEGPDSLNYKPLFQENLRLKAELKKRETAKPKAKPKAKKAKVETLDSVLKKTSLNSATTPHSVKYGLNKPEKDFTAEEIDAAIEDLNEILKTNDSVAPLIAYLENIYPTVKPTQTSEVLSPEDKIVWGHPGLGKTTFKENNPNNVLDFDTDFKPQVAKALGLPKDKQNSKGLNEWRKNNSEEDFKSEMRKAWKKAVAESKKTGKMLVVSDMMFLEENEADFDKVVTTSKEAFKERATKRGDNTKGLDSWKSNIDKTVSSVDSSKVINTDKYFSEIQPTQQDSEVKLDEVKDDATALPNNSPEGTFVFGQKIDNTSKAETDTIAENPDANTDMTVPDLGGLNLPGAFDNNLEGPSDDDDGAAPFKVAGPNSTETFNEKEDIAWFKERFPGIPISIIENISNVIEGADEDAWGVFYNSSVYIAQTAGKGTVQHEAFHAVYRLMLKPSERKAIFNEARKKFGIPKDSELSELMSQHPKLSDEQIVSLYYEEKMADAFAEYIQTKEVPKTLGGKIKAFFKKLYQLIKSVVSSNVSMDEVFYRADNKFYKRRSKVTKLLRSTNNLTSTKFGPKAYKIPGMSNIEARRRAKAYNFLMFDIIARLKKANPEHSKVTDTEMMEIVGEGSVTVGLSRIYQLAFGQIQQQYNKTPSSNTAKRNSLKKMLDNFMEKVGEEANGAPMYKLGKLYKLTLVDLRLHGINVNFKTDSVDNVSNSPSEEDSFELSDERSSLEGYQIEQISTSSKEFGTQRLKTLLRRIVKINKTNDSESLDDLAHKQFIDYHELHNTLERDLADSQDLEQMLKKLKDLSKMRREYAQLVKLLESSPEIAAEFFTIFSRTHAKFMLVRKFKNGEVRLISSNRLDTANLLLERWKNNLSSNSGNKVTTKGEIDKKKAEKIHKELVDLIATVKESRIVAKKTRDKIKKLATAIGINIEDEVLQDIATESTTTVKKGKDKGKEIIITAKQNLLKLLTPLEKVALRIANGENPYEIRETADIREIASIAAAADINLMQSAFRNGENKTVYSHILSNSMSRTIAKIKGPNSETELAHLMSTSAMEDSVLLNELSQNFNSLKEFEYILLDGYKGAFSKKAKTYTKLSEVERELSILNLWIGSDKKIDSGYGHYPISIPSDAPVLPFIKMRKYNEEEVVDHLYTHSVGEQKRIYLVKEQLEDDKIPKIKNIHTPRGTQFIAVPALNDLNIDIIENPEEAKEVIRVYLKAAQDVEKDRIDNLGLMNELDKKTVKNLGGKDAIIESFTNNHILAQTQILTVFGGDPAFYKNSLDIQKRFKQIWSPITKMQPNAKFVNKNGEEYTVGSTYETIYLDDNIVSSRHTEELYKALLDSGSDEDTATKIAAQYGRGWDPDLDPKVKQFATAKSGNKYLISPINETDAQAYITIDRYRDIEIGLGRWTQKQEDALPRLRAGKATTAELEIVLGPRKPFMFGFIEQNGHRVPVQHKNSELVLLPQLTKKSPKLDALRKKMEKDGIDSANFESAVKVGLNNTIESGKDFISNLDNVVSHQMLNENYGQQQETPEHHTDTEDSMGVQIKRLVFSDIDLTSDEYILDGEKVNGRKMFDEFQSIFSQDIIEAFTEVDETLSDIDKLQEMFIDEIRSRQLGEEFEEAVEIIERKVFDSKTGTYITKRAFKLPLFSPVHSRRIEQLLNSIYTNKVNKIKMKGANLIQVSSFGFSDDLDIKFNEDGGVKGFEVFMPWWTKKYFPTDKNGEVDIERIRKEAPELLESLIGYRVPTEDKYSMPPLIIKDFLPRDQGSAIILPTDITTLTGSDFDVDKMKIMIPEIRVIGGKVETIKYMTDSNSTEEDRYLEKFVSEWRHLKDVKTILKQIESRHASTKEDLLRALKEFKGEKVFLDMYKEIKGDIEDKIETGADSGEFLSILDLMDIMHRMLSTDDDVKLFGKRQFKQGIASEKPLLKLKGQLTRMISAQYRNKKDIVSHLKNIETEILNELLEKSMDQNLIPSTEEFSSSSIEAQNTKKARANRKLEIMRNILTSPATTEALMTPGNFDNLKAIAEEIADYIGLDINEVGVDILTPSGQAEIFKRNMAGKELIGIFANHNSNHAITQFLDSFGVSSESQHVLYTYKTAKGKIKGIKNGDLTKTKTLEEFVRKGEKAGLISRELASFLAAVVDNAKEPISNFFNLNTYTADVVAYIVRAGFPARLALLTTSQPILKAFTTEFFNRGGTLNVVNAIWDNKTPKGVKKLGLLTQVEKMLMERLGPEGFEKMKDDIQAKPGYSEEELITWLKQSTMRPDDRPTSYYIGQYKVALMFREKIKPAAEILSRYVSASKVDGTNSNNAPGPTISHTQAFIRKVDDVLESMKLYGQEVIFDGNNKQYPTIGKYYESINKFQEKLDEEFLWNLPAFKKIHEQAAINKGSNLTPEELEHINYSVFTFLAAKFGNFVPEKEGEAIDNPMEVIITKFPGKLKEYIEKYPELEEYSIIPRLEIFEVDKDNKIPSIDFTNIIRTTGEEKDRFTESWEDLLFKDPARLRDKDGNPINTDEEYEEKKKIFKAIGRNLILHAYFSSGFVFRPGSYSHMLPTSFWASTTEQTLITDLENETITPEFQEELDSTSFTNFQEQMKSESMAYGPKFQNFLQQYYQNFPDRDNLTKRAISYGENKNITKIDDKNKTITVNAKELVEKNGYIRNSDVFSENKDREIVFSSHINYTKKNSNRTLMYRKDEALSNEDEGIVVYSQIDNLGVKNKHIEFYPDKLLADSIHSFNSINAVTSSKQTSDFGQYGESYSKTITVVKDGVITAEGAASIKAKETGWQNVPLPGEDDLSGIPSTKIKKGVEISSNSKGLAAALTNPTEKAKSKGNLTQSYPIEFNGKKYKDVETAYQALKDKSEAKTKPTKENSKNYKLMVDLISAKLEQHPKLVSEITKSGGLAWLISSTHQPTKQNTVWETGGQNWFIEALSSAYELEIQIADSVETKDEGNYYEGDITPEPNTVFVFGSNPQGKHGAGAAKVATTKFGAKYGQGRGLQGNAFAIPTKDLTKTQGTEQHRPTANSPFIKTLRSYYKDNAFTDVLTDKNPVERSVSVNEIVSSISELYKEAKNYPNKQFKVAFGETEFGFTLNGYLHGELIEMFNAAGEIPSNVIFSKTWYDTGKLNLSTQLEAKDLGETTIDDLGDPVAGAFTFGLPVDKQNKAEAKMEEKTDEACKLNINRKK